MVRSTIGSGLRTSLQSIGYCVCTLHHPGILIKHTWRRNFHPWTLRQCAKVIKVNEQLTLSVENCFFLQDFWEVLKPDETSWESCYKWVTLLKHVWETYSPNNWLPKRLLETSWFHRKVNSSRGRFKVEKSSFRLQPFPISRFTRMCWTSWRHGHVPHKI